MNKVQRASQRSKLFKDIQTIGQKKWKQMRRDITFYEIHFRFREPYKVLCDGTFLHHCRTQRLGKLEDSITTFLGVKTEPLVTSCVIAELIHVAEAADVYSATAIAAQDLQLIECEHELSLPAAECITALVGSHNEDCYFVATQDLALRKQLRQVPGVALIYANYAPLNLEYPSVTQQRYAHPPGNKKRKRSELEFDEGQKLSKSDLRDTAGLASTAAASIDKFDKKLPGEKPAKKLGKHRKFLPVVDGEGKEKELPTNVMKKVLAENDLCGLDVNKTVRAQNVEESGKPSQKKIGGKKRADGAFKKGGSRKEMSPGGMSARSPGNAGGNKGSFGSKGGGKIGSKGSKK